MRRATLSLFVLILLGLPPLALAAEGEVGFPFWGPILSCTGNDLTMPGGPTTGAPVKHCNNVCDILATGQRILYFALTLAILIIAPLMFLSGGVMIAISRGNTEQYSAGVKTITGAVGGIVLILLAFVIVNTFFYLVSLSPNVAETITAKSWSEITCTPPTQ